MMQSSSDSMIRVKMRTAADVVDRIMHDPDLNIKDFRVGYIDRFVGVLEKRFIDFKWGDPAMAGLFDLSIPEHRIEYFKYHNEIVWDKKSRVDKVYGSSNSQERLADVIMRVDREEAEAEAANALRQDSDKKKSKRSKKSFNSGSKEEKSSESSDSEDDHRFGRRDDRPNMFISIPITNLALQSKICDLQQHMLSLDPRMEPGLSTKSALHVTLLTLKIEGKDQLEAATEALHACKPLLTRILPREVELSFIGLTTFRHRVLVTQPQEVARLSVLVNGIKAIFVSAAGRMIESGKIPFKLVGNRDPFTPHVTIAKLSRPMIRDGIDEIHFSLYKRFIDDNDDDDDKSFLCPSFQNVSSICLCDMGSGFDFYGFYPCHATVVNDFSCLTAPYACVGLNEKLVLNLSNLNDDDEVNGLCRLMFEGRDLNQKQVIIMRGIPGCGKSFISDRIAEFLNRTKMMRCYIACADDERIVNGKYVFNAEETEEMHRRSTAKAKEAMMTILDCNDGYHVLISSNTNIRDWEYSEYVKLAQEHDWPITIMQHHASNLLLDSDHVGRMNSHGVSSDVIFSMSCRFAPDLRDDCLMMIKNNIRVIRFTTGNAHQSGYSLTGQQLVSWLPSKTVLSLSCMALTTSTKKMIRDAVPLKFLDNSVIDYVTLRHRPDYSLDPTDSSSSSSSSFQLGVCLQGTAIAIKEDDEVQLVTVNLTSSSSDLPVVDSGTAFVVVSMGSDVRRSKCKDVARDGLIPATALNLPIFGQFSVRIRLNEIDVMINDVQELRGLSGIYDSGSLLWLPWEIDRIVPSQLSPAKLKIDKDVRAYRVVVIDFDLCLVKTPDPPKRFDGDFLSMPESLSLEHEFHPFRACFNLLRRSSESSYISGENIGKTVLVLLTGRQSNLEQEVKRILRVFQVDVLFDHIITKPKSERMPTCDFKVKIVDQLALSDNCAFPNVKHLIIVDDDGKNLEEYRRMQASVVKPIRIDIIDSHSLEQAFETSNPMPASVIGRFLSMTGYQESLLSSHEVVFVASFLRDAFSATLKIDPSQVMVVETGSFISGKKGCDLDLCCFCTSSTPIDFGFVINRLASQLTWNSIKASDKTFAVYDMRISPSVKRPRLSFNLVWLDDDDMMASRYAIPTVIEIDVSFCFLAHDESIVVVRQIHDFVRHLESCPALKLEAFLERSQCLSHAMHQLVSQMLSNPKEGTLAHDVGSSDDFSIRCYIGWLSNWFNLRRVLSCFDCQLRFQDAVNEVGNCVTMISKVFHQHWCAGLNFGLTYRSFMLFDLLANSMMMHGPLESDQMNGDYLFVQFMRYLQSNPAALSWQTGSSSSSSAFDGRELEILLNTLNHHSPIVSPYLNDLTCLCIEKSCTILSACNKTVDSIVQLLKPINHPGPPSATNYGILSFHSSLSAYDTLLSFQGRAQQVMSFLVFQRNIHVVSYEHAKNAIGLAFYSGHLSKSEMEAMLINFIQGREMHQEGFELSFHWVE